MSTIPTSLTEKQFDAYVRSVSEQMRLRDKLSWRFHIQGQMGALGVIVDQELISPLLSERQVIGFERCSAKFFPTQRAVEALDESLVVLLVWAGDHML